MDAMKTCFDSSNQPSMLLPFSPLCGNQENFDDNVQCVCIGSGRFLRSVLVPTFTQIGVQCIIAQPRGTSFVDYIAESSRSGYIIDEIALNGTVSHKFIDIAAVGSLGSEEGRDRFLSLPSKLKSLRYIGIGLTEGGLLKGGQHMSLLYAFLGSCEQANLDYISVINTDNVPGNGNLLLDIMKDFASSKIVSGATAEYLEKYVTFHNTMVDCITSHRAGNPLIPLAESLPMKALVIEDIGKKLPEHFNSIPGVIIRLNKGIIEVDHALKIRIANGTHTAMAHIMSLSGLSNTTQYSEIPHIMEFLTALYQSDIAPSCIKDHNLSEKYVDEVWADWISRLKRTTFGLSTFFIGQNAFSKLGLRLMPSINASLRNRSLPSIYMTISVASLLCFITPSTGWLDEGQDVCIGSLHSSTQDSNLFEYTTGLTVNFKTGLYEFRRSKGSEILSSAVNKKEISIEDAVLQCLISQGLDRSNPLAKSACQNICIVYKQLIDGSTPSKFIHELFAESRNFLNFEEISRVVIKAVNETEVVDLHTHLFPPSHEELMLWGIDELLCYHYLVAEYFMISSDISPNRFHRFSVQQRADIIWDALFIKRSPISEATRGVLTTLNILGLQKEVETRDLEAIRSWFQTQDKEEFTERVFFQSRVKYCVMTNVPFDLNEASHWRPIAKQFSSRFRTALRVDPLLAGNLAIVQESVSLAGYDETYEGVREYLKSWVDTLHPEYLMASTPQNFIVEEELIAASKRDDKSGSPLKGSDLLYKVLLPLAEELSLPIALKLGAHRGVNPALKGGGDGVVTGQVDSLRILCSQYPKVKFLCTFLARSEQHEAAVLANKMANLHLYGCWWYCNNPSIITEITAMRLELLGTGFTVQHSDARVLDQLLYKWAHSREVIGKVLVDKYEDLARTGWKLSEDEIRRDVNRIFGGAYEEFMLKKLF